MYSPQFTKHCTETGRWPVSHLPVCTARSTTIQEELDKLHAEAAALPKDSEERASIIRRGLTLKSALAKFQGKPLPPKELPDDEFETAVTISLT